MESIMAEECHTALFIRFRLRVHVLISHGLKNVGARAEGFVRLGAV